MEEECDQIHAISKIKIDAQITSKLNADNDSENNGGHPRSNKSRGCENHIHVEEELDLNNYVELPRKRTNSEVAEHKAKAEKAIQDLKTAELKLYFLRLTNITKKDNFNYILQGKCGITVYIFRMQRI